MSKEFEFSKHIEEEWISKEGYKCFVVFNPMGHRCGYVKVDEKNITNEINGYDDIPVNVHGGLTYGCNGIWGFDCAHAGDTTDKWTLEAVKEEVNKLSKQLSELTWEDMVKAKLEFMPDWFKNRVEIKKAREEK